MESTTDRSGICQNSQVFLTIPKPSDFYVTNVRETEQKPELQQHVQKVLHFAKIYKKFAWFLYATETSRELHIYRVVSNGNYLPSFVPFDRYTLVHPSSTFSGLPLHSDSETSVIPQLYQWKRKPLSNIHKGKPAYLHQQTGMKMYVSSQDLKLDPDEMCVCPISKSQSQFLAVKKQNYIAQQRPAYSCMNEVEIQSNFDADYKGGTTLVEPASFVALTDHYKVEKEHTNDEHVPYRRQVKLLQLFMNKHSLSGSKFQSKGKVKRLVYNKKHHFITRRKKRQVRRYTSVSGYHLATVNRYRSARQHQFQLRRQRRNAIFVRKSRDSHRCATKRSPMTEKAKVHHETHLRSSDSELDFTRQLSVFGVLKKYNPRSSERFVQLPIVSSPAQSRYTTFLGIRHQELRSGNVGGVHHTIDNFQTVKHSSRMLESDGLFLGNPQHINVVHLPFDVEEITQLLHAPAYSKVILQLETVPRDIPPESFIPLHFILGVAYFKLQKYEDAKEFFKQCEAIAMCVHRDGDVMICNAYLGDMESASKLCLNAGKYYQKAIKHYTPGSVAIMFNLTLPTISTIHAKLAFSYQNASMIVQAIFHYKAAINVAKTDRDQLSAHTSLGNLYQSMGDNSNALNEYKRSIQLAEKLSDFVSLGWAHGNIGNAYLGLNKKDEAVYHLQKSLDLAVEYEQTPQAIGRTYNNLGTAYQSMNDLDKAEEYYDLALNQAIYGNDIAGQARVYGNIGNVHMLRKNYERAIPHYSEVLRLSKDPSPVSTARHNRGCAYYEWATSLEQKNSRRCTYHGPDCDMVTCQSNLSFEARDLYQKGYEDLKEVVKYHEERLQHIKGSPNCLTLSVSLFESNSRTFHRLQDCLARLHRYEEALVVAEQCRARTLGELLLTRRKGQLTEALTPPLSFDQIVSIVNRLEWPLIYFSYTGARLICWVFTVIQGQKVLNTFEVPLTDDQFDEKSFDYHLRYSLTEKLVERTFDMYKSIEYNSESSEEVQTLFEIVGKPIVTVLQKKVAAEQVTAVSDSYTSLLPLTCLLDPETGSFLGDHYYFNIAPSLLTMGIMNKLTSKVDVQEDVCVVIGDPNIPPFYLNNQIWILGRLPYARQEAEWVSHTLKVTPILGDQATKGAFLIRLMNAKIVHIATHGNASAGFLAFASFSVGVKSGSDGYVDGSNVLLYPEDIEKLNISPALVVLSSCYSSRGTVKADRDVTSYLPHTSHGSLAAQSQF